MRIVVMLTAASLGVRAVSGQEAQLTSVFPPGGQQGTSVEVVLEGKNLATVRALVFSHSGLSARQVKGNRFAIDIAAATPVRDYDLWAVTAAGLSNPRRFAVGDMPELKETESNDEPKGATAIKLPVTINGVLQPGTDRDYYRFDATAGQRVTFHACSEKLDGSARLTMTVLGLDGKELRHDDGREPEPTLDFEAPAAGSYLVKVEERSYQTGDNNSYRLHVFSGPRIVAAFPQTLTRGTSQPVTLYGYRLSGGKPAGTDFPDELERIDATIAAPERGDADGGAWLPAGAALFEGFRYRHPGAYGVLHLGLEASGVSLDQDVPHSTLAQAQSISVPCVIAGRFLRRNETDWYRLAVKKGQLLWVEAIGERAGRAMDLEIGIHDGRGQVLLTLSDFALKKGETSPFPLNTADPMGLWKVEADGEHYVVVRDLFGTTRWGATRTYRLLIDRRREEVCVVVPPVTNGIALAAGASLKIPIVALRRGGHEGPIRVQVRSLPPGLQVGETVIPAKQSSATLTFSAAKDAAPWAGPLTLSAETEIDGKRRSFPVVGLGVVRPGPAPVWRRCDGIVAVVQAK